MPIKIFMYAVSKNDPDKIGWVSNFSYTIDGEDKITNARISFTRDYHRALDIGDQSYATHLKMYLSSNDYEYSTFRKF